MRLVLTILSVAVLAALLAPSALAFRFTDEARNTPTGTVGQPYSHALTMAGGCALVTMKVSPALPPGLRLEGGPSTETQNSWRITGTPTSGGAFTFWLIAGSNWPECSGDSTEEEWTIRINGPSAPTVPTAPPASPISIQQSSLPGASTGVTYATKLTATGAPSVQWTVIGGALPAGVALAADGTLTGSPSTAGDYSFTVRAQSGAVATQKLLTIAVREAVTAVIQATKQAEQGIPLTLRPAFAGGVAPHTWSLVSGPLPAGVTLDTATGAITGTPTVPGTFALELEVADKEGRSTTVKTQIVVNTRIAFAALPAPSFVRGVRTSVPLLTTGGVGKKQFKVVAGRLPVGLRLNVNGMLVGTPRFVGRSTVVVRVTDGYKVTATRTLVLVVKR
jgi:hypothetical protein